jgi:hypothetical protein
MTDIPDSSIWLRCRPIAGQRRQMRDPAVTRIPKQAKIDF